MALFWMAVVISFSTVIWSLRLSGFSLWSLLLSQFNSEIRFKLSSEKFEVGKKYLAVLEAFNEPLPMILKFGKVKIEFIVKRDLTRVGIGFYKNPAANETMVFAKLTDESGPIEGRKIRFEYKHYAANEGFKNLGEALTDEEGRAEVKIDVNDTQLLVVKAEFEGDELYEPSATSEVYTSKVNMDLLAEYLLQSSTQKSQNAGKQENNSVQNNLKHSLNPNVESKNETWLVARGSKLPTLGRLSHLKAYLSSSTSIKVSIKSAGDSVKLNGDGSGDSWSDFNTDFDF